MGVADFPEQPAVFIPNKRPISAKFASIKGFRSLWDVSITDLGTINVFFCENNSGKSNILEALETLFKVEQKELPVSGFYRKHLNTFATI